MRKNLGTIILGLIFIAAGVGYCGNAIGIWSGFTVFFPGWWAAFIIVPCLITLLKYGYNSGSLIGLLVGVFLLLAAQDSFSYLWKMILPVMLILIGVIIIFNLIFVHKASETIMQTKNPFGSPSYTGVFSTQNIKTKPGEVFRGADITAVFGSVQLDLTDAQFESGEVLVNITSVFASVEITVPRDAVVKVVGTPIFGSVDNKAATSSEILNAPTINVRSLNIFSGTDIKQSK